jgi:hypothetical protein
MKQVRQKLPILSSRNKFNTKITGKQANELDYRTRRQKKLNNKKLGKRKKKNCCIKC